MCGPDTASVIFLKSASNLVHFQFVWLPNAYTVKCSLLSFAKFSMIGHQLNFPLTSCIASFKYAMFQIEHSTICSLVTQLLYLSLLFNPPRTVGV